MELATENLKLDKSRVFFNLKELQQHHAGLAQQLQTATPFVFQVPETTEEAMTVLAATPSIQFSFAALAVTLCARLALGPLGVTDLGILIGTKMFWEIQEWIVHTELFHGSKDMTSIGPFESHDRHHILPYYHVSTEPLPLAVGFYLLAATIAVAAMSFGAPAAQAMTWLGSYTASGIGYMLLHFLAHTRLSCP
ncbi:expressed unknown protein [Seminavis robusta]|uniref:Uncharacterized protein n=1 Tax=Seminavis robusta TaxID=568900 RepID=A0A9N8HGF7_9STRA|nr:expressed unknown protein [Seminavis robusta]|eukprot:Sro631_g178500.1 n/a (194) ;mRNA; r:27903-28484